jgi:L-iditol 2-dehydrogenase
MKIAVYYNNSDIRIQQIPIPKIGKDEILMQTEACGICGTDVLEWYRTKYAPLVLGHEVSGIIKKVGQNIKDYKVGERISVSHHVPCNSCHYCYIGHHTVCETLRKTNFYPGGFSQFIRIPSINVKFGIYRLPKDLSFEEAVFIEPLACCIRGQRQARMQKGKSVLILGSGVSGILHIQLAHFLGASLIIATDISDWRLEKAKEFGADFTFQAKELNKEVLREKNKGNLIDLVIVCTTAKEAFVQALESIERAGVILFFAPPPPKFKIPISITKLFWRNEITLTSSYAGSPSDHLEALDLIHKKKINVRDLITHRLKLEETQKGFQLVSKAEDSLKVIIKPNE